MKDKYWALVFMGSSIGLQRIWLNDNDVIELMKNDYNCVHYIYRLSTSQIAILKRKGKTTLLWQDVPSVDYKGA